MKSTIAAVLVLALGAAAAPPALAQHDGDMHGTDHGAMSGPMEDVIDDAMDRMMAEMHGVEPTGDPDADFLLLMIPHHQSAVDMAKAVLPEIDDPEVTELARAVIAAQEAEIAMMEAMLERLGHAPGGEEN